MAVEAGTGADADSVASRIDGGAGDEEGSAASRSSTGPAEGTVAPPAQSGEEVRAASGNLVPAAPRRLALPAEARRVAEGDSAVRVSLDRPAGYAGPLRVEWRTVSGTALDGDDYAGADWRELDAPPGAGTLVLYVPIVSDARAEPRESFFVEIRTARGGPEVGEPARLEVVITDDD